MKDISTIEYVIFFMIIVCIIIITTLVFQYKTKQKSQVEKLNLYKAHHKELEDKLNLRTRELIAYTIDLTRKDQVLQSVEQQLQFARNEMNEKGYSDTHLRTAIRELKPNNLKRTNVAFEKQFVEMDPVFYRELNERFDSLTPNERKLCAFLKLNLTTKEISEITQQSTRAIEVARYRLRKKMNLDRKENLVSYISKIS